MAVEAGPEMPVARGVETGTSTSGTGGSPHIEMREAASVTETASVTGIVNVTEIGIGIATETETATGIGATAIRTGHAGLRRVGADHRRCVTSVAETSRLE